MTDEHNLDERIWEVGFEGHEKAQLSRLAGLSFAEKMKWLEEAHQMVLAFEAQNAKNAKEKGS
jgi:hypothetical protein